MSAIRAFIAVDLSPEIEERLEYITGQLKSRLPGVPVRWVPASNVHLTLKFLGDVSTSNLEMLHGIIRTEAERLAPFEISVGELGAYPSIHRPRVMWVGIEAPIELDTLQNGIETETARLGYAREKRTFSPHLTLGRVSRNASTQQVHQIADVLCDCKVGFLGATRVQAVHLYRSDLRPQGAVYSRLFSADLLVSD